MKENTRRTSFMAPIRLMPVLAAGIAISGIAGACSSKPSHPSGAALYVQYCASCHGAAGKGDGPVAASLRTPPSDLTTVARRSGGSFNEADVMAVIDGRRVISAHGTREMPVWGRVFEEELKDSSYPGYTSLLRAQVLADYLRTLQQP